jgi:hypothetical protein
LAEEQPSRNAASEHIIDAERHVYLPVGVLWTDPIDRSGARAVADEGPRIP